MTIETFKPSDRPDVVNLLTSSGLPIEGVEEAFENFFIARDETGRLTACAGFEKHSDVGLLRSVAVAENMRGTSLGINIVEAVLQAAKKENLAEIVLLTTTAKDFFENKLGFEAVERSGYEKVLEDSVEWNLPRCSSAVVMRKEL